MSEHIQAALHITFRDPSLLDTALTHRSYWNEHPERSPGKDSNERLEFLGDSVLNMLAAEWLYSAYPDRSEGELSMLRSALVRTTTLARFAHELNLGRYIRISRGEKSQQARERPSLLADAFEAVMGAVYLDQGLATVRTIITPFLVQEMQRIEAGEGAVDHRTRLQEYIQGQHGVTPVYQVVDVSGPDHQRQFTVEVLMNDTLLGRGVGTSKQQASQDAARVALAALKQNEAES
ncbi:MAG: ribonuclease III [Chloroflexaceae bacterium]|nr:ribonuclease III [Chloroflexaceae bacterium]NJL35220.1 ribonuclease III [Chloroflexaceae bacterium]NJO04146.1 ribonuclease III [Chloroflexaceae bacterium]